MIIPHEYSHVHAYPIISWSFETKGGGNFQGSSILSRDMSSILERTKNRKENCDGRLDDKSFLEKEHLHLDI